MFNIGMTVEIEIGLMTNTFFDIKKKNFRAYSLLTKRDCCLNRDFLILENVIVLKY
jgi:hypothetical protein